MIPFKLGKLRDALRRASCVALALLIFLNFTLPAFAAASSQGQTVGWAETVSSFLMASGIYPYTEDEQQDFHAWSNAGLSELWGQFTDDVADVGYDIVDMTATLAKGVIDISTGRWNALRAFATWLVNKHDIGDNQTGVEIGGSGGLALVPAYDTNPTLSEILESGLVVSNSKIDGTDRPLNCMMARGTDGKAVYAGFYRYSSTPEYALGVISSDNFSAVYSDYNSRRQLVTFYFSSNGFYSFGTYREEGLVGGIPVFSSSNALIAAFNAGQIAVPPLLSANTTAVSVPPALPETAQSGGISVVGTGASISLTDLEGVIQTAVTAALKPQIELVLSDNPPSDTPVSAPTFPQVDYPQVISITLMASGIYPKTQDGQNFPDWSVFDLVQLWDAFRKDVESTGSGENPPPPITDVTGSIVQGNVVIDSETWDDLRQFIDWVVKTYDVGDNETDLQLPVQDGVTGGSPVTVDTGTVTVPESLPEGQQFGALPIPGVGLGGTVAGLVDTVTEFVEGGLKPEIPLPPIKVDLSPDVELSPGGEIKPSPDYTQTIEIGETPLTPGDYAAPNLTGVFPFSIPWDVIAILSALNAEPVRPDFEVSIYVPVLDIHVPFHIGVNARDAEAVDSAFAVWRNMLLVLMCVGTLILFAKMLL